MTRAWFAGYSPLTTESPLLPQVEADSWQSLAWRLPASCHASHRGASATAAPRAQGYKRA